MPSPFHPLYLYISEKCLYSGFCKDGSTLLMTNSVRGILQIQYYLAGFIRSKRNRSIIFEIFDGLFVKKQDKYIIPGIHGIFFISFDRFIYPNRHICLLFCQWSTWNSCILGTHMLSSSIRIGLRMFSKYKYFRCTCMPGDQQHMAY